MANIRALDNKKIADLLCLFSKELIHIFGAQGYPKGMWDYGYNYNNDEFIIHRYCWCEKDSCSYCFAELSDENYTNNFIRNAKKKYGFVEDYGSPNFWHKPTNTKIWWYKYIGRSMLVYNPNELTIKQFSDILGDCLVSIKHGEG